MRALTVACALVGLIGSGAAGVANLVLGHPVLAAGNFASIGTSLAVLSVVLDLWDWL